MYIPCSHSIQEERDVDAIAMETGEEPGTGQEMAIVLHEVSVPFLFAVSNQYRGTLHNSFCYYQGLFLGGRG